MEGGLQPLLLQPQTVANALRDLQMPHATKRQRQLDITAQIASSALHAKHQSRGVRTITQAVLVALQWWHMKHFRLTAARRVSAHIESGAHMAAPAQTPETERNGPTAPNSL